MLRTHSSALIAALLGAACGSTRPNPGPADASADAPADLQSDVPSDLGSDAAPPWPDRDPCESPPRPTVPDCYVGAPGMCSGAPRDRVCTTGLWVCPAGTTRAWDCGCPGERPGCACAPSGWACPDAGVDAP